MGVLERARSGLCSFGLNLSIMDPVLLEIAKAAGYDFVRLDCEHILFDDRTVSEMLRIGRLLDLDVQVRVPDLTRVTALLDNGAQGIMAPHIESREEVWEAEKAVKYPPKGERGLTGAARVLGYGRQDVAAYQKQANREIALIVQIESRKGLENIEEILQQPGLDMVATGRNDLSQSLGIPGKKNDPSVLEAENFIIRKTLEYGKTPTILCKSKKRFQELYDKGVRCFTIARDDLLLKKAAENQLTVMKEIFK